MRIIVDGNETFVGTGGREFDPALPAVVFLHGAGLDHSVWALLARWFAHHGCGVLAPDLPGHGRSAGAPLASIAALADWTAALVDAAGARTARLVGHSMGSLIALETAARHPDKVNGLGLIATAAAMTGFGRSSQCRQGQRPRRHRHVSHLGHTATTRPSAARWRRGCGCWAGPSACSSAPGPACCSPISPPATNTATR